ncbi:MAG TPA: histidinol-phosphate transaminase [Thermodesulfovibrionia bacterium]|nr:histidinol-phosphate transaminase [Thermodesulfovibrionia bacterium]
MLKIIDFSKDTNPLGVSKKARAAMRKAIKRVDIYPDTVPEKLIRHLAKYHHISPENILCGCGTTELIDLIARSVKPKRALILSPGNPKYARSVSLVQGNVDFFTLEQASNFSVPVDQFITAMAGYDMVFIANPNDPTGRLISETDMERIAQCASNQGTHLVIDESFMDFCNSDESFVISSKSLNTTTVLRSFSKFHALSGLRLGYITANVDCVKKLQSIQTQWTVNSIAQAAAVAVLGDKRYTQETKTIINQEKAWLVKELTQYGVKVFPSEANYFLMDGLDKQRLAQNGINFMASSFYGMSDNLTKIPVRKHRENAMLVKALKMEIHKN